MRQVAAVEVRMSEAAGQLGDLDQRLAAASEQAAALRERLSGLELSADAARAPDDRAGPLAGGPPPHPEGAMPKERPNSSA